MLNEIFGYYKSTENDLLSVLLLTNHLIFTIIIIDSIIMKFLSTILITVCISIVAQAQTFQEVANKYLGYNDENHTSFRVKTNYGTFPAKLTIRKGVITKVKITITNENNMYDTIMKIEEDGLNNVGSIWTDFTYTYYYLKNKEINDLEEATKYYQKFKDSPQDYNQDVEIYKRNKKERYIVGIFEIIDNKFLVGKEGTYGYLDKFSKIK